MKEQKNISEQSALYRWAKLVACVAAVYVFSWIATPMMISTSTHFTKMANFIEASGIDTGMFYYTDVEVCAEAELGSRSTFEYTPGGKSLLKK